EPFSGSVYAVKAAASRRTPKVNPRAQSGVTVPQGGGTQDPGTHSVPGAPGARCELSKQRELDVQEFLGIRAEVADELAHVAGDAGEVVVKLGIGEQLSGCVGVLIELGSSLRDVAAGVAKFVVKSLVGGQLAERALAGANVAEHSVAIGKRFFGLIIKRGIVEQLAHGALLRAQVGENGVDLVESLVRLHGGVIRHKQFADGALPSLHVADNLIAFGENAAEVVVGLLVGQQFAKRTLAALHAIDKVLHVVTQGFEIRQHIGAALDNFLDGFLFRAGNRLAFLERHARVPARDGDIAVAEESFRDETGGRVREDIVVILVIN